MISKTEQDIIRGAWGYALFQTLTPDIQPKTVSEFLREIISSSHHFWQGDKFENGLTWTWEEKGQSETHKNVKTFGFYDNNDIKPSDYKPVDYDLMENELTSLIMEETNDKDYEVKIRTLIRAYKDKPLTVYQFLPDKLEKSKFSVYNYFIAFILVDNELKKATRIEFGLD